MTAGLPGLGISGLFYLILVLIMPVRELYMTVTGRTSVERWKAVGFQWALAIVMTAAVWVEFFMVRGLFRWIIASDTAVGDWLASNMVDRPVLPYVIWATGITLAIMIAVCLMTYFAYRLQKAGLIRQTIG
jgi:hypothetical protein